MIRMNDISFQYAGSLEGVHDLNLTVKKGECVVLTGPSGSGKTTITRLLNGLAPSYYPGTLAGQIYLDRDAISTLAPCAIGRRVGSVFQDPKSQFFSSELGGEIAFACENYGFQNSVNFLYSFIGPVLSFTTQIGRASCRERV